MRVLGLACTCQRMHDEVMPLLYKMPTFVVDSICTLPWWRDTLLPLRFDSVRSLSLNFFMLPTHQNPNVGQDDSLEHLSQGALKFADDMWDMTWGAVAQMKGLRSLRVQLTTIPGAVSIEKENEVLEPLRRIERVKDYQVLVGWELGTDHRVFEVRCTKVPFRLVRSTNS